jgi:phage protein D
MPELKATISVDGEEALDFLASLMEMEVEEDHRMAATARVKLCIRMEGGGSWRFLDDDRVKPWKALAVSVIIDNEETDLFDGFITQVKPAFVTDENACSVEIVAMDATCLMGLEEKIKNWPDGETDSSIADTIFGQYGLDTDVEDTVVTHDEAVSTVIQRETDIRFLKRLARRNGYECFVKGGTGFFRKPMPEDEAPLPTLAAHFGAVTNLMSFSAKLNALHATAVEMHQIDFVGKAVEDASADSGQQRQLGADDALSVSAPGFGTGAPVGTAPKTFVKHAVATGQSEMERLCRALFDEAEWLIEGEGEVNTVAYGSVLEARRLVPIKGVGEVFSGIYYVTNVKHVFTSVSSYTQKFKVRRNALVAESGDFAAGGLLGALS